MLVLLKYLLLPLVIEIMQEIWYLTVLHQVITVKLQLVY